ncbi:uncharacterized protein PHALS_15420 [Plasmopara halstedii]|uniref:Uncharacterized protein n=1 Tax=Plasmopara halstedii TaxID=4781 RepID=A0A0P1AG88_PLAHL|nr:uncharacterized protein PHALS_15420 [Plasmopara halstedii]CEG40080.1 hypothetical protein PHALS_15420 [Plasmopara halstedii]|eukprot:XP_024576449.1 hypothetical protein PHALS_15420 [Plasmopara halstedii]
MSPIGKSVPTNYKNPGRLSAISALMADNEIIIQSCNGPRKFHAMKLRFTDEINETASCRDQNHPCAILS